MVLSKRNYNSCKFISLAKKIVQYSVFHILKIMYFVLIRANS